MTKHNKSEKPLWPYIVISFAIVFAMAVVIQHWTNTETETVYSNDTSKNNSIENLAENYQEVDDVDIVDEMEVIETVETVVEVSFGEAFSKARTELGVGRSFVWEGKEFTTFLAGEDGKQGEDILQNSNENELAPINNDVDDELVEKSTIEVFELVENQEIN